MDPTDVVFYLGSFEGGGVSGTVGVKEEGGKR
jgi:hypothetical protein